MKRVLALVLGLAGMAAAQESFEELARKAASLVDSDPAQSIEYFKKALDWQRSWAEGWFYMGGALFRLERYKEAREAFTKGLEIAPKNGVAWAFLGMTDYEMGDLKQAALEIDRGERIGLGGNLGFETAVRQRGAMLLIRASLFDQAMAQMQPLAKRGVDSPQIVEAVGLCALATSTLPEKLTPERRKIVQMAGAAMWAASNQEPQKAREGFEALLKQYPNEAGVHYAYGLFLMDSDQATALEAFHAELKQNPQHWPTMLVTAFLETRAGQPDVALALAEKARKLAPAGYLWLCDAETGRALLAKEQAERAVPYFEKAVKAQPDNAQTHFYLEQAYRRSGRKAEAAKERAEFTRLKSIQDPNAVPGIGTR